MALREFGTFPVSANYEPQVGAPFDARQLVNTKAALTIEETWLQADGGKYIYNGMIVAVGNDKEEDNNGLYLLLNSNLYYLEASWMKLASNSQIQSLQKELEDLELSGGSLDIEVATKEDLPLIGNENATYYVKSDKSIWRWDEVSKEYISYGAQSTIDINIIHGGNANGTD